MLMLNIKQQDIFISSHLVHSIQGISTNAIVSIHLVGRFHVVELVTHFLIYGISGSVIVKYQFQSKIKQTNNMMVCSKSNNADVLRMN